MRPFPTLLVILLAAPAAAQEGIDCATAYVQVELNWCAEQDWQAADAELNDAYRAAMAAARAYEGDQEALLRDAQRAWIAFRDAACSAEGSLYEGGSMQPMMGTLCMARVTRARTEELWSYADSGAR